MKIKQNGVKTRPDYYGKNKYSELIFQKEKKKSYRGRSEDKKNVNFFNHGDDEFRFSRI